jgi:hypothetical protein
MDVRAPFADRHRCPLKHEEFVPGYGHRQRCRVIVVLVALLVVVTAPVPANGQPARRPNFWVECRMAKPSARIDPIVSPGQVSMHTHMFFGMKVRRDDTNRSLRRRTTNVLMGVRCSHGTSLRTTAEPRRERRCHSHQVSRS